MVSQLFFIVCLTQDLESWSRRHLARQFWKTVLYVCFCRLWLVDSEKKKYFHRPNVVTLCWRGTVNYPHALLANHIPTLSKTAPNKKTVPWQICTPRRPHPLLLVLQGPCTLIVQRVTCSSIAIVIPIVDTRRGLFCIVGSQPTASGAGTVSLGLLPVYEARLAYSEVTRVSDGVKHNQPTCLLQLPSPCPCLSKDHRRECCSLQPDYSSASSWWMLTVGVACLPSLPN